MSGAEREVYRRRVVGYVWQHSRVNLWPELTALENLQVPMLAERAAAGRRERAAGLLEMLGLQARLGYRPAQLSGEEQQRLALGMALANGPRLLLADEPTAELDGPGARSLLADLAAVVRHTGTAAVMVTHDHQVERYVDRVIQIRDGRTSAERRWVASGDGLVPEELVILDRVGRLQLPRHLVDELGLGRRVRVRREGRSLRCRGAGRGAPAGRRTSRRVPGLLPRGDTGASGPGFRRLPNLRATLRRTWTWFRRWRPRPAPRRPTSCCIWAAWRRVTPGASVWKQLPPAVMNGFR